MIDIWNNEIPGFNEEIAQDRPHLEQYLIKNVNKKLITAFIICPGGSYTHKAEHEGIPVGK